MLAFAACSSDAAAPTTTEPTASTAVELTTTTAPSTTSTTAPPSTAPPTSSEAEIEAELVRVVEGSYEPFYLSPIDPSTSLIDQFYEPELAAAVRANMSRDAEAGNTYFGEFVLGEVRDTRLSEISATLVACGIDSIGARSPNGEIVVQPDDEPLLRTYEFQASEGLWLLANVTIDGAPDVPCE